MAPRSKKAAQNNQITRIMDALAELRLSEMAAALREYLDHPPDADQTRLAFLEALIEPQLNGVRERRIERLLKGARFPSSKTFDAFDWGFNPKIDRELIMQLASLEFIHQGRHVLCAGMPGTGKSHIAVALGHEACAAGLRVRYTTSAAMLDTLYASLATATLPTVIKRYINVDLLIIDEVGIERPERDEKRDASLFYKVIDTRTQRPASTIITTNIDWEDWGSYLGDPLATAAILDRLVGQGYALNFKGKSYRAARHQSLNDALRDGASNRPDDASEGA